MGLYTQVGMTLNKMTVTLLKITCKLKIDQVITINSIVTSLSTCGGGMIKALDKVIAGHAV